MKTSKTNKASFGKAKQMLLNSLLVALTVPGVAMAADAPASPHTFTANVGVTTDYIFRGISQTSHNAALQGGADYVHASGLYAGLWGSNVNWITASGATGNANIELDTYLGFRNTLANEFSYDVGFIRYNYLGSYAPAAGGYVKADTDEVYFGVGYKWLGAKYSHGLGKFLTVPSAAGTNYIEINANAPLGDSGFTLGAHAGKQTYKGTFADALASAGTSATYSDYKLGVSKDFSGFLVALAYTNTNASTFYTWQASGGNWGKGTAVLSVTRSF